MPDGMFLRFTGSGGPGKVYAELPAGEFGYSDAQGLYEWRRVPVTCPHGHVHRTELVRIHYTGGDRQGSSNGQFWTSGPELPGRVLPYPHELGFHAAQHPVRLN